MEILVIMAIIATILGVSAQMALSEEIRKNAPDRYKCPNCHNVFTVANPNWKVVDCPHCNQKNITLTDRK